MLDVEVRENTIRIGPNFSVNFEQTLRIPDDGNTNLRPGNCAHSDSRASCDLPP